MNLTALFGPPFFGIRVIVAPYLRDWDQFWLTPDTVCLVRTAYTALRFDLWLERIERERKERRHD